MTIPYEYRGRLLSAVESAGVVAKSVIGQLAYRIRQHLPAGYTGDVEEYRAAMRAAGVNLDEDFRAAMIEADVDPELALSLLPLGAQFSEDQPQRMTIERARRISDANARQTWTYSRSFSARQR